MAMVEYDAAQQTGKKAKKRIEQQQRKRRQGDYPLPCRAHNALRCCVCK